MFKASESGVQSEAKVSVYELKTCRVSFGDISGFEVNKRSVILQKGILASVAYGQKLEGPSRLKGLRGYETEKLSWVSVRELGFRVRR